MKFGTAIQRDKNVDLSPIVQFVDKMDLSLRASHYGQIEDIAIGVICVKDEIRHLLPERKTKVHTAKGYMDMEISFPYHFVRVSSDSDLLNAFVQKLEDKLLQARSKFSKEIIDSSRMIEDIKALLHT